MALISHLFPDKMMMENVVGDVVGVDYILAKTKIKYVKEIYEEEKIDEAVPVAACPSRALPRSLKNQKNYNLPLEPCTAPAAVCVGSVVSRYEEARYTSRGRRGGRQGWKGRKMRLSAEVLLVS